MCDSELTDDEIVEIIGPPPPLEPQEILPDPDEVARKAFLQRVSKWLVQRVELNELREALDNPDSHPTFLAKLRDFLSSATERHVCWEFSSPQSDWNRLAGRAGFALVLDGDVTHVLLTLVS